MLLLSLLLPLALSGPELAKVDFADGASIEAPAGWRHGSSPFYRRFEPPDGKAALHVHVGPRPVDAGVRALLPDAKPVAANGWTCAEAHAARGHRLGACGSDQTTHALYVYLEADDATYRALGGLDLVRRVAATARGFKPPADAGNVPDREIPKLPPPPPPRAAPISALLEQMISGRTRIHPSERARRVLAASGTRIATARLKLCIDASGAPTSVDVLKTSASPWDRELQDAVREWRFRPYTVRGRAIPVCATIKFGEAIAVSPQKKNR